MAMENYTDLQNLIADYLNRTDMTTRIVDFIQLTESRIVGDFTENNLLNKLLASEVTVTDQNPLPLPAGYRGTSVIYVDSSPIKVISYLPPDEFFTRWASSETGAPTAYTIQGNSLLVGPNPDSDYNLTHWYVKRPDLAAEMTNSILTNYPNLYLYGALSEAYGFLGNDQKQIKFETRYLQIVDSLEDEGRALGALQIFNRGAGAGTPGRYIG